MVMQGFAGRWLQGLLVGAFTLIAASPSAMALNCSEVRQLTSLYFKMHYSYNNFDDELSKRTLDNFIKSWDPGKLYFFESDVKEFEQKYNTKLDDAINSADCSAIDEVMSRYAKRFEERQRYIYEAIEAKHDFTIDEYMMVDAKKMNYPATQEDVNDRWRKRVKFQLLSLKTSVNNDMKVAREKLRKRYELALKRHNDLNKDKVYGVFLNAFSMALDPHTSYMPADELEDFRIRTRLSLEGIGASLRNEDGFTIVADLVKGGAAERGGILKTNDKIIAVAQGDAEPVDVIDMDLQDVVKKIRGARGTVVKLTVIRETASKNEKLVVPIVREKIQLVDQQASSKVINMVVNEGKGGEIRAMKLGVVTLPSFYIDFEGRSAHQKDYRSSSVDTLREINKMQKAGVDAVIMDLRSNGGGSLEESINMAGLFIDKGPIVQVKSQTGSAEAYFDKDGKTYYSGPLVVLINRSSASASEIFAGAIQDYGRGLIVGDSHTFGKGTVQNLNDVDRKLGAVKVTVNKFYRASGASTQMKGVEADIRMPSMAEEFEIGEKFYDYALPFETIKEVPHQRLNMVGQYVPTLQQRTEKRMATAPEFKEIFAEIDKYKKNAEERSRVSLKEKDDKADKDKTAQKDKDKSKESDDSEDPSELALKDDVYLQEALQVTSDYVQLLKGRPLGESHVPELLAAKKEEEKKAKEKEKAKKTAATDKKPSQQTAEVEKGGKDAKTEVKEAAKPKAAPAK